MPSETRLPDPASDVATYDIVSSNPRGSGSDSEASCGESSDEGSVDTDETDDAKDHDTQLPVYECLSTMTGDDQGFSQASLEKLRNLLDEDNSQVNALDNENRTPLHIAAEYGLLDAAKVLINAGADVRAKDEDNRQPLHLACMEGKTDLVRLLLEEKADIEDRQAFDATPLDEACWNGQDSVVEFLLKAGANPCVVDGNKWSPLYSASCGGHESIVKQLLDKDKSNINETRHDGRTPLHAAIYARHSKIASILIEYGAQLEIQDDTGWTPLMAASATGDIDIARQLINAKVNYNTQTKTSEATALISAISWGNTEIAEALLHAGSAVDVNIQDKSGATALHEACSEKNVSVVKLLLLRIDDVDLKQENGRTALHIASELGDKTIVELLLERTTQIDEVDNDGKTALHLACGAKISEQCQVDSDREETPNKVSSDGTANADTKKGPHAAVIELLLENKANWGLKTKKDETVLHLAATSGDPARIRLLIRSMGVVDLSARAWNGWTVLYSAFKGNAPKNSIRGFIPCGLPTAAQFGSSRGEDEVLEWAAKELEAHDIAKWILQAKASRVRVQYDPLEDYRGVIELAAYVRIPQILSLLIDNSPNTPDTDKALEVSLKSTLEGVEGLIQNTECKQLAQVLCLLIINCRRGTVDDELKQASVTIGSYVSKLQSSNSNQKTTDVGRPDPEAPQRSFQDRGARKGSVVANKKPNMQPSEKKQQNAENPQLEDLIAICDILRDPPFTQIRRDRDEIVLEKPDLEQRKINEEYEATVVRFYKSKDESGTVSRHRKINEVIYDEGPAMIMEAAINNLSTIIGKDHKVPTYMIDSERKPRFTWVHLPAPNMTWMNHLLAKIAKEEGYSAHQYHELKSYFRDSWVEVPDRESVSRVMRPRVTVRQDGTGQDYDDSKEDGRDEENQKHKEGKKKKKESKEDGAKKAERIEERNKKGRENEPQENDPENEPENNKTDQDDPEENNPEKGEPQEKCEEGQSKSQMQGRNKESGEETRETPNGANDEKSQVKQKANGSVPASAVYMPYFCFSTNEVDDAEPSNHRTKLGKLLKAYKTSTIHRSPTLDEWYYHFDLDPDPESAKDQKKRNQSQVVTKYLLDKEYLSDPAGPLTLLRVNQLWVWTIGNGWLITATSCLMDDSQDTIVKGVLDELSRRTESGGSGSQPSSITDMKRLIVDYCIDSYDRRPKMKATASIGQTFSNYLNRLGRRDTDLFEKFRRWMQDSQSQAADTKKGNGPKGDQATAQARRKSRDGKIRQATNMAEKLYCDIKDVRDELSILKSAVQQQEVIQKGVYSKKVKDGNLSSTYVLNDLKELETVAERIESAVNTTLSLQQSEIANFQAEEATYQSEMAYKQSERAATQATEATKQGKTLMAFTFATVLFLPLSFLSSLFALDVASFQTTPTWAFAVIFVVSVAVSAIIVLCAIYWDKLEAIVKRDRPSSSENPDPTEVGGDRSAEVGANNFSANDTKQTAGQSRTNFHAIEQRGLLRGPKGRERMGERSLV